MRPLLRPGQQRTDRGLCLFSASIRESIEATLDGELPEPNHEAHRQIVEAIASGDPDKAGATVRRFMAPLIEELERLLAS